MNSRQISSLLFLTAAISLWAATVWSAAGEDSYVLFDRVHFSAYSPARAILKVHRKIWISDERNKAFGDVEIFTNEFIKIKAIKAWIEDENGREIKKLGKSDILESSISAGNVLYSGKGWTLFSLAHHTLPYFIEYQYEIEFRSLLFWPGWYPQRSIPVRLAVFELAIPKGLGYHTMSIGPVQEVESGEGRTWLFTDIPAAPRRYMCPPEDEVQYGICFSPRDLVLDGVQGNGEGWENIGRWFYQLSAEQYGLEPGTQVGYNVPDSLPETSRVQKIYAYVQNATRYVAIQPGVHGWKPHEAQTVHDYKYGDCKDLTVYFITLLEREGIRAYPALLRTRGSGVIKEDFPVLDFNHVIAYVPLSTETLWVDCTEDHTTVWDLPPHDEGCAALVIENGAGQLMWTPVSEAQENRVVFTADAEVRLNKDVELVGLLKATGNEAQIVRQILRSATEKERQKIFTRWLGAHSPEIELKELRFLSIDDPETAVRIEFRCIAKKYGNSSAKRFYFQPSFLHRVSFTGEEPAVRHTAVFYPYPHAYTDHITYRLPDTFASEALPDSARLIQPFGEYEYLVEENDGCLTVSRRFRIDRQRIELSEYPAFYEFMRKAEDLDAARAVFTNSR